MLRKGKTVMIRLYRMTRLIASVGMLLLLAGCLQSNISKASQAGLKATPGAAQLVKTGIAPTNIPLHPSPTPTAPAQINGEVTLQLTTAPQHASDSIVLTLNNATNQTILFSDHLTECSVVLLQMQPSSAVNSVMWQTIAPCRAEITTRLHALEAEKTLTISLIPPSGRWSPGLYRGQVNYLSSGAHHQPQTFFSSRVQIGA